MIQVAYLVSDYLALSHSSVQREAAALREAELAIAPFSIQASEQD